MVYRNLISIGRNMNPSLTSHLIQKWLRTDPGVQRGHLAPLLPLLHQGHQTAREKWCRLHRAVASLRAKHLPTVSGNAVSPFLSGFSLVCILPLPSVRPRIGQPALTWGEEATCSHMGWTRAMLCSLSPLEDARGRPSLCVRVLPAPRLAFRPFSTKESTWNTAPILTARVHKDLNELSVLCFDLSYLILRWIKIKSETRPARIWEIAQI